MPARRFSSERAASRFPRRSRLRGRVAANLKELEVPYWHGSGRAWNERHPAFALPDDYDVVFEPDAGMLRASRAVALQVELARTHGGDKTRVLAQTPVQQIDLSGPHPIVVTESARIVADRLIVSAGAWVKRLLPELPVPLRVTRQQVLYFRPDDPTPFRIGRFPVFIFKGVGEDDAFYGMPEFQDLGVKVARHAGPNSIPTSTIRSSVTSIGRSCVNSCETTFPHWPMRRSTFPKSVFTRSRPTISFWSISCRAGPMSSSPVRAAATVSSSPA